MTDDATLQRYLDEAPLHGVMGQLTVRLDARGVVIEGVLSEVVDNGGGVVHGGAIATLLDTALTFALIAPEDRDWTTMDIRVDYLRPLTIGPVAVTARVVHAGRRTGHAEGELRDASDVLCARATGTFVPSA